MNKIPQNYNPTLDLKETQDALNLIELKLFNKLTDKLDLLKIREPKISSVKQSTEIYNTVGSRTVNFDSINSDSIFHLYNKHNYFLINAIKKLNIQNNKGIITKLSFIDRDVETTNITSMEKTHISIEYRFDNQEIIFKKLDNLIDIVYRVIFDIFSEIKYEFSNIKHNLPEEVETVIPKAVLDTKLLKESLIDKYANDNGVFKLKSKIPEEEYEIDVSNKSEKIELFFYSRKAHLPMNAVTGLIRQDYDKLSNNSNELNETLKEELKHAKQLLVSEPYKTINLKIDIDQIAVFMLDKAHILEVQSGLNSYEIEEILKTKGIEHL